MAIKHMLYSFIMGTTTVRCKKRIEDTFPPKDYIQTVYEHLAYFYQIGVGSGYGCIFEFLLTSSATPLNIFQYV